MSNLYEEEIKDIYENIDPVKVVDEKEEEKTQIVITNHKDYVADDCLNIIHKDFKHIAEYDYNIVDSYLDINIDKKYDELIVMNVLSSMEISKHEEHLEYWTNNLLKDNGEILIQDLCLDNIVQFFFNPNELNGNNVTAETLEMGISAIFGSKDYKRRSIIVPVVLSEMLTKIGFRNIMMQQRGTMVMIKGSKEK